METEILDILQLFEYSMSIGQSLDYNKSCSQFLKLILKRNDLNASWILKRTENGLQSTYALPTGEPITNLNNNKIEDLLNQIQSFKIFPYNPLLQNICPIEIKEGNITIFSIENKEYLFFYSKKDNMTKLKMNQILPIVKKFFNSLKACVAFEKQGKLLIELEKRNDQLNDYAQMVSHDLKSPLRNINTMSTWLNEELGNNASNTATKYMDLIKENTYKMEKLISGILTYSSLDINHFKRKRVDLNKVIEDTLHTLYIPKNTEILLNTDFPVIRGNTYQLQQLFQNLISNAIKHNNKKNKIVELSYKELPSHHEISIKDNGNGIDLKYHDKIFNTFTTLENAKDSTGIGLSIVDKIIDNYEGEIRIQSKLGIGSTFYCTLKK